MKAVVVSIGSELVEGFLTDTNATFLAQEMAALGIELVEVFGVGDHKDRIVKILERGWEDAQLIVTTGGIGPTDDDLTRESIAALVGEEVAVDPELLDSISRYFAARGTPMPEQNAKQAWTIPSCEPLLNPMGTAPGWFVRRGDQVIVSMPGVPREMRRMWHEQAVPRLLPYLGDRYVVSKTLKTIGIGESAAERAITDIIHRGEPVVATYAKNDGVHIRVTSSAPDRSEAERAVQITEAEIRAILGDYIYGEEPLSLGAAILAPLITTGDTISIGEAGSGGHFSSLIAEEPASVVHFRGGLTRAYAHATAARGLQRSEPDAPLLLAREEARAIREMLPADFGLGIVVRLSSGETQDRTRGDIALCLVGPRGQRERTQSLSAVPSEIRRRAALLAGEFLWNALTADLRGGNR